MFSKDFDAPFAIRVPRGASYTGFTGVCEKIEPGISEMLFAEKDVALLAVGSMVETADAVRDALKREGLSVTLVNARFTAPVDRAMIASLPERHRLIVTMEENVRSGGFGEHVSEILAECGAGVKVLNVSIPDCYVEHGSQTQLRKNLGLDAETVTERVLAAWKEVRA